MAYDDFDPELFKDKQPQEDSFGLAVKQGRLLSSTPSIVAQALGIDPAKAGGLDPEAIRQHGRAAARAISTGIASGVSVEDQPTMSGRGQLEKQYSAREVGPQMNDPKAIEQSLAVGGKTQGDQRNYFQSLIDGLASKVSSGQVTKSAIPKQALDILTYAKKMDAYYTNQTVDRAGNPVIQQTDKVGPYEKTALLFLFDANHKILPDYMSQRDAQVAGYAPSTDMGGTAAPGSTQGVSRGTDAAGNPSFTNVAPGLAGEGGPSIKNISQTGGAPPSPSMPPGYGPSPAGMGVPPGSPSQERMLSGQPLVQPEAPQQFPGSQAIGIGPAQAPPPVAPPAGDANVNPQGMTAPANFQPAAQAGTPGQSAQKLRVKLRATGQIGTISANEFNPAIYELAH